MRKLPSIFIPFLIASSLALTSLWLVKISSRRNTNISVITKEFEAQNGIIQKEFDSLAANNELFMNRRPHSKAVVSKYFQDNKQALRLIYFDNRGQIVYELNKLGRAPTASLEEMSKLKQAIQDVESGWVHSCYEKNRKDISFTYLAPIQNGFNKSPSGYIATTYKTDGILLALDSLSKSENSYASIVAEDNSTVLHPFYHPGLVASHSVPIKPFGKPLLLEHKIPKSSGWKLQYCIDMKDIHALNKIDMVLPLFILLSWGITAIYILVRVVKARRNNRISLWVMSLAMNLLFIGLTCSIFHSFTNLVIDRFLPLTYYQSFIAAQKASLNPKYTSIPTSIEVNSITFPNSSSFSVSGFISQIYPKDSSIKRGFLFPEEGGGHYSKLEEVSRYLQGDHEIITWQFDITLQEAFSSKHFPLDRRQLMISLWPLDPDENVEFTFDTNRYKELDPSLLPGLNKYTSVEGWNLNFSQFENSGLKRFSFFQKNVSTPYPTSFVYTIQLQRNLTNAFISNFIPFLVCITFTFFLFLLPNREIKGSLLGVLSVLIAIMFVVALNQAAIRKDVGFTTFANIEYLFIIFYTLILVGSINFLLYFGYQKEYRVLKYEDNLIPRLLYWPILSGSFFVIIFLSMIN